MKAGLRWLLVAALGLAAAGGGYWLQRARDTTAPAVAAAPTASPAAETPLLAAEFLDLDGRPLRLDRWAGQLVVVNFWATWCPPCVRELPAFMRLQQTFGARGLQFVGVALDSREEVAKFVAGHGIDFPVVAGEEDVARYMRRLGNTIGALPYTVVIGPDGRLLHSHQGEWPEADAARLIEGWLAPD
jgi:peroxiredoxin